MKRLSAFLSLLVFTATLSFAADYVWTGSAHDGNYANPANWQGGVIPAADSYDNTVYMQANGVGTLTLGPLNIRLKRIVFENTNGSGAYVFKANGALFDLEKGIMLSGGDVTFDAAHFSGSQLQVSGSGHLRINDSRAGQAGAVFTIKGDSTVLVSGTTAFADNLKVDGARVIVSGSSTLPASGKIENASGYVGYTQDFAANFSEFLSRINAISDPNAIIGIDSANPSVNRNVSDAIDLSHLNGAERHEPYYLGTTSKITLSGNITPTLSPTGAGYDALHLAALDDGYLKVTSQLGGANSHVNALVVGQSAPAAQNRMGTVEIAGANSYSGGTRVLGGTLYVNSANAPLGSGTVTVGNGAIFSTGAGTDISNSLVFEPGSTFLANGTFMSRVVIGNNVTFVPGGYGNIAEVHMHDGITFVPGSIWNIDLGANSTADKLCTWDSILIQGDAANPIYINLFSVKSGGGEGAITSFDTTKSYTWTVAYRPNNQVSIIGFDPSFFNINAVNFSQWNPNNGLFGIEQIGQSLAITFTPVPEPGAYALMAAGLGVLAIFEFRRRRRGK